MTNPWVDKIKNAGNKTALRGYTVIGVRGQQPEDWLAFEIEPGTSDEAIFMAAKKRHGFNAERCVMARIPAAGSVQEAKEIALGMGLLDHINVVGRQANDPIYEALAAGDAPRTVGDTLRKIFMSKAGFAFTIIGLAAYAYTDSFMPKPEESDDGNLPHAVEQLSLSVSGRYNGQEFICYPILDQ